jgi:hypothetical protein
MRSPVIALEEIDEPDAPSPSPPSLRSDPFGVITMTDPHDHDGRNTHLAGSSPLITARSTSCPDYTYSPRLDSPRSSHT